ncbi:MAG: transporter [Thermodesulfobacteriota bacterium]|nr:transporter [Thermodesulfobacteriota bacterium]
MRRIVAAIAITIILLPCICLGEEKLLITDVLEKGEKEVGVFFSYVHESHEISFERTALNADRDYEVMYTSCVFNVGLGHRFEVGAGIPYVFSARTKIEYPTVPTTTSRFSRDGFGDINLGGRYLVFDETEKPFTLVAGLDVKPDTASEDDGGTGTTNVAPYVAASATVAEDIRPFASYIFVARNHGTSDFHKFTVGVEKEFNEDIGLRVFLDADFYTSSDSFGSHENYYLNIGSYIRICNSLYVVPRVRYGILGPSDEKNSDRRWESANNLKLTFGLYCLF